MPGQPDDVRRTAEPFPGALRTVTLDALDDELPDATVVLVAAALTPETDGLFDARRLALMSPDAWLVNVARGRHVVTDDLVAALCTLLVLAAFILLTRSMWSS
mgnify:CR=1 FL=1